MNKKLKINITFGNEALLMNDKEAKIDHQPLIAMFGLLLEWEMEDTKQRKRKNNEESQYGN